jgi:hypothetical protein
MARGDGYAKGENHPRHKLTDDAIRIIRRSGDSVGELARRFNVCKKTMRSAKRGITWKHVPLRPSCP